MKKIIVFVIVISFLLIIGGFLNFKQSKNQRPVDKVKQTINTSKELKREHCLKTLCIQSMEISYQNELGIISFILINKGSEVLPAGFIKLEFDYNPEFSYISYHSEMLGNETQKTEIQVSKDNIIQMKDYEIKELTATELKEVES